MGGGSFGNFGNTKGSGKINGYTKKLHEGKQGKHMPSHKNYQKGRSIFYGSIAKAQELVNKYGGTGDFINKNRERVDFKQVIGAYIEPSSGLPQKTTVGIIHYSKTGTHIVPAKPVH